MTLEHEADIRVEGSIPQQIVHAARHIERLMPKWSRLGESGVFEPTSRIPRDAWHEGLVNAVVHRSYSMMGDHIRVEIFPNRVEFTSPGRFRESSTHVGRCTSRVTPGIRASRESVLTSA